MLVLLHFRRWWCKDLGWKKWTLSKQVADKLNTNLSTNIKTEHGAASVAMCTARTDFDLISRLARTTCFNSLHLMQHRTIKSTVEPSYDGISPLPACSSIPGEKGQFKYHLHVKTITITGGGFHKRPRQIRRYADQTFIYISNPYIIPSISPPEEAILDRFRYVVPIASFPVIRSLQSHTRQMYIHLYCILNCTRD